MRSKAAPVRLAVVVAALALVGSACGGGGNGGGSTVAIPAEAPAGRCAEQVSRGVYEWERCAWETYRESAEHNRALSDADADALIALVWRQVEVEGKPAAPPTSALVPRDTGCTVGLIAGCYDQAAHHIARSDPFTRTLLHEIAHALTRDHPETEECRQTAGGHHIDRGPPEGQPPEGHTASLALAHNARCSHGDVFRCVADHLFTEYASIPPAGVCGTEPPSPANPPAAAEPACTLILRVEGVGGLCQVGNTSWFRIEGPEGESVTWSSLDPESHTWGYLGVDDANAPTLDILCQSGSLSVYVDFVSQRVSGQQELGGRIPVYYELDGSPRQETWEESDFNELAISPDPAAFAESLAESQELVFSAWNADGSLANTITFDTTGAHTEVNRALTACGIG